MPKASVEIETAFNRYSVGRQIGEGGAGRVFECTRIDDERLVAVKFLSADKATMTRRARFKNEIAFLMGFQHKNIVPVYDYGVTNAAKLGEAFYVMPLYASNLRKKIGAGELTKDARLKLVSDILDGIEAAHLQRVVHRDLKPENILFDENRQIPVIADFGIARFAEDQLLEQVRTRPGERLANFMYAAPEQRQVGQRIEVQADIYALGLMMNEVFTGEVPHGTDFKQIASVFPELEYIDQMVVRMLRQNPNERPKAIADVKIGLEVFKQDLFQRQSLSANRQTVIKVGEVEDSLAHDPPRLVDFSWNGATLELIMDRPVHGEWVVALHNVGNYMSVWGKPPQAFVFAGDRARISAQQHEIQPIIDHFKAWLPAATASLKTRLEAARAAEEGDRRRELDIERRRLEAIQQARQSIKI